MDQKKRRINYLSSSSGNRLNRYTRKPTVDEKKNRGPKKKLTIPQGIRRMLILMAVVIIFVFLAGELISNTSRSGMGSATQIGATLSQNILPFGDSVLFYDGTTLHCVSASGGNEWSYQIGQNADYDATDNIVVAWSGNDVYILNKKGRVTYNAKMTDTVQFASAGEDFIAIFIGEADKGVITVINQNGQTVDSISVNGETLLDIGFFKSATTSSAQPTELMWVLALNTTGTVISTELQTYQPGKLATGKSTLGNHVAYRVFFADDMLNVVDTREISYYTYRVLKNASSTLIYGYTLEDVKDIGKATYKLLVPDKEISSGNHISNVRLMSASNEQMLHLPEECLSVSLGSRSVYGFSNANIYVCRYGETGFKRFSSPVGITSFLGMITNDRAVVASGSDIYVLELPK